MLSQLLFVRLKAAENALRDGRLDEAYRLAGAPDLRGHRRGAAVLTALTEKFIERARVHYRADRFVEALADLDRAESGGVLAEEIAELRGHVLTVQAEQQRQDQSRRDRLKAAKRRIEGGSLAAGRKILEEASEGDRPALELRRNAEVRAKDAQECVDAALALIGQGQLAAAADRIRRGRSIDGHNEGVARAETTLCGLVIEAARRAIDEGRLSRAADELACLGKLGDRLPEKCEVTDLLALARQAAGCVKSNDYAEARRHVMSLQRFSPKAKWVAAAVEQLRQLNELRMALRAGPLGDLSDQVDLKGPDGEAVEGKSAALDDTVAIPSRPASSKGLPDRLLLLVDGGGSFLILRGNVGTIGRVATGNPADVAVFSDIAERHANVTRVDDDYFLFATRDVEIGGCKTRQQLLRDGDRMMFGRKAKMTFRLPSRKSPTAVLDLSDTTKMPNDVRRVVLFNHHATIGPGSTAHIHCRHAVPPLVLFERGGALWIRPHNDGHVDTEARRLTIGEPIEVGGAGLVLEPWKIRTPGPSV